MIDKNTLAQIDQAITEMHKPLVALIDGIEHRLNIGRLFGFYNIKDTPENRERFIGLVKDHGLEKAIEQMG